MGKPATSARSFIMTLSDNEDPVIEDDSSSQSESEVELKYQTKKAGKSAKKGKAPPSTTKNPTSDSREFNENFVFSGLSDVGGLDAIGTASKKAAWNFDQIKRLMKPKSRPSVDDLVNRHLQKDIEKQKISNQAKADIVEDIVEVQMETNNMEESQETVQFDSDADMELMQSGEIPSDSEGSAELSESPNEEELELSDEDALSEHFSDDDEDIDDDALMDQELDMSDASDFDNDIDERVKDLVMEKRKAEYFDDTNNEPSPTGEQKLSFQDMNLSRPLARALADLQFTEPTRIQALTIPIALQGKDICGAASTGSGKTAAFLLPIFERLLYRPKSVPATRVLVLTPTRELAAQCHSVGLQLAKYTDITFALCVGGMSIREQEMELKKRPDVIIATPGRLIDHIQNSQSFSLDAIEILIMDEADRMLEEGFQAELTEIIKDCPRSRQTLLFSATMTDNVDQLIRLSLNRPVKLFIDSTYGVTQNLTQEFIRVRVGANTLKTTGKDDKRDYEQAERNQRESILLALCLRTFKNRTIIFCPSKVQCHRLKILFSLQKIPSAELHGNLTQLQRLESLESFRDGQVSFLIATDLAARGLDIAGVETVINFQLPAQYDRYVHRVGRTARHDASGRAVTLVGEKDRKMVKQILKNVKNGQVVKQRVIPAPVVQKMKSKIMKFESAIEEILQQEKDERGMQKAEMDLAKAENMIKHADEIYSRPAKQWFQSEKEKRNERQKAIQARQDSNADGSDDGSDGGENSTQKSYKSYYQQELAKEMAKANKHTSLSGLTRKQKRRKMMNSKEDKDTLSKNVAIQKVAAKQAKRAARDGVPTARPTKGKPKKKSGLKRGFD